MFFIEMTLQHLIRSTFYAGRKHCGFKLPIFSVPLKIKVKKLTQHKNNWPSNVVNNLTKH